MNKLKLILESINSRNLSKALKLCNEYEKEENKNKVNKVVNMVNGLIEEKKIGYIEQSDMVDGLSTIKVHKQNIYHDVFAEVEKVAYKLNQLL